MEGLLLPPLSPVFVSRGFRDHPLARNLLGEGPLEKILGPQRGSLSCRKIQKKTRKPRIIIWEQKLVEVRLEGVDFGVLEFLPRTAKLRALKGFLL